MENGTPNPDASGRPANLPVLVALAGIFMGWFVLDTLVIQMGPVRHTFRFFEMLAAIIDPAHVLMGLDSGHMASSIVFGLVCATLLMACLARSLPPRRPHPVLLAAPLMVMLLSGLLLYLRMPGEMFAEPESSTPIVSDLVRLANDVFNRGAAAITRAGAGAGLWLAALSSVLLAWLGFRGWRR